MGNSTFGEPRPLSASARSVRRLQHGYPDGARSFPRRFPVVELCFRSRAAIARPIGHSAELLVLVAPPVPSPSQALLPGFRRGSPDRQIPLLPLHGAVQPDLNFSQFPGNFGAQHFDSTSLSLLITHYYSSGSLRAPQRKNISPWLFSSSYISSNSTVSSLSQAKIRRTTSPSSR
jgi:hypothetical protein